MLFLTASSFCRLRINHMMELQYVCAFILELRVGMKTWFSSLFKIYMFFYLNAATWADKLQTLKLTKQGSMGGLALREGLFG